MLALFDVDARGEEYAPGALADNPLHGYDGCPGCLARPCLDCAACGAPASVALPAGEHAMTLCERCYSVVLDIRASAQEHRERMAPNTAAMIAGRQKLRERQKQRQKQRQEQYPATSPVAPARANVSPDLSPSMPTPAHSAQPIQAPLFDLDAMLQEATRQIVQDITRRVFQPMADAMGLALTDEGASTTPGADLLARSEHPTQQNDIQARQQQRERERLARQQKRAQARELARQEREREREERQQTRTQARQQASRPAQGRNVTTRGAGALTARTTRQQAQTHQTRQTYQTHQGRPSRRADRREELAPVACVASGASVAREHRGEQIGKEGAA